VTGWRLDAYQWVNVASIWNDKRAATPPAPPTIHAAQTNADRISLVALDSLDAEIPWRPISFKIGVCQLRPQFGTSTHT
jgi:hypothetical protein